MSKKNLYKDEELYNGLVTVWGNDVILHPYSDESKITYKSNVFILNEIIDLLFQEKFDVLTKKTSNLDEEKVRLERLISLLDEYSSQKEKIKQNYLRIILEPLMDVKQLEIVDSYEDFKYRLDIINTYMDNQLVLEESSNELEEKQKDLNALKGQLTEEENNNLLLEQKLSNYLCLTFGNQNVSKYDYEMLCDIEKVTKEIIDSDLERFNRDVLYKDSRREINLSIMEEKNNYLSYITKTMFFKINELIEIKDHEYSALFDKRIKIINLIGERKQVLSSYNITDTENELVNLVDFINDQLLLLDSQKHILDEIGLLEQEIINLNDKISEYDKKIKNDNVLHIVNEYIHSSFDDSSKYNNANDLPLLEDFNQDDNGQLAINDWEKNEISFDEDENKVVENNIEMAFEPVDSIQAVNIYEDNNANDDASQVTFESNLEDSGDAFPQVEITNIIEQSDDFGVLGENEAINSETSTEDSNGSVSNDQNGINSVVLPKDEVVSGVGTIGVVQEKSDNPKIVSVSNPKFLVDYKRTNSVILEISKMFGIEKKDDNTPLAILSADDTQELYDMLGGNV